MKNKAVEALEELENMYALFDNDDEVMVSDLRSSIDYLKEKYEKEEIIW